MSDMNAVIALTLKNEGGFQKSYNDRANWSSGVVGEGTLVGTKYGITALDLPGKNIENLNESDAIQYYKDHFWKTGYSQINSQKICCKIFDLGVLFGVGTAIKTLQLILGTAVDGVFGPGTLEAVNSSDENVLLGNFKAAMIKKANSIAAADPNKQGYLTGWKTRIES